MMCSVVTGEERGDGRRGGRGESKGKAMRDLPGDKSQTRSGLLRGWMRCAIMRIFNVGVFSDSAPWTAPEKENMSVSAGRVCVRTPHFKKRGVSEPSVSPSRVGGDCFPQNRCSELTDAAGRLLMSQQDGES